MKNIVCFLTLLLFVLGSFSQTPAPSKDYYLKKSKTQKTVGWVMIGGGVVMTTISILIPYKQSDNPFDYLTYSNASGGAAILLLGGIGTALGSIPFFISSAKNKRKAASIVISDQNIFLPRQNSFALKTQPTITLKIGF